MENENSPEKYLIQKWLFQGDNYQSTCINQVRSSKHIIWNYFVFQFNFADLPGPIRQHFPSLITLLVVTLLV